MYAASFTLERFFENERDLLSGLFYLPGRYFSTRQVVAIWIALLLLPLLTNRIRRRALWFGAALAILGPLPVAFLPWRTFYVMYVPLMGWSIWFAAMAVSVRDGMVARIRRYRVMGAGGETAASILLAACLALFVARGFSDPQFVLSDVDPMARVIEDTRLDYVRLGEPLARGSRVLLLHSRFPDNAWGPLMMAQLLYRDPDIWMDRPTIPLTSAPTGAEQAAYDCVFDFDGRRMFVVGRKSGAGPRDGMRVPR